MGLSSIDPVLMIRMLIVGYVFAIRSERLLCREVKVNLAYRWFCGLSIEDKIPEVDDPGNKRSILSTRSAKAYADSALDTKLHSTACFCSTGPLHWTTADSRDLVRPSWMACITS
jgi:transposase